MEKKSYWKILMLLNKQEKISLEANDRGKENVIRLEKSHQTILEWYPFVPLTKKSRLKKDLSYARTFQEEDTKMPNTT